MAKQTCVAAHYTDSEIRAHFLEVQLNKYLRCVQTFLRHDMTKPAIIYGDNQAALDIMAAGHITSRVKHMAVPIKIFVPSIFNSETILPNLALLPPASIHTQYTSDKIVSQLRTTWSYWRASVLPASKLLLKKCVHAQVLLPFVPNATYYH